jgi:hypothetical protein
VIAEKPFSGELEGWLRAAGPKCLGDLDTMFGEKSFAVAILFLMLIPALPLPTGGISHVFEAITLVVATEMVIGARTLWLPARWRARELGLKATDKAIPFMVRRIRWFERFSRPRWASAFGRQWVLRLLGLALIGLTATAALSPPFSGLDTIPSMGAVAIALGIILEDMLVVGIGIAIGTSGVVLVVTIGSALFRLIRGLF